MEEKSRTYTILMLEDDADDRHITESTLSSNEHSIDLVFLVNGHQVMQYLTDCGSGKHFAFPDLILLDKNVPLHGGLDVLRELKAHPVYKKIPVVMVSGTAYPQDVAAAYELGANSFIQKPANDRLTLEKISSFVNYWFDTVELPAMA
ncbi:response regulator [Polluticoccus soli]|uniref:response regulator n=1 Tax=Polluticoccus soli TaxID=3034150 RepID=UPI0023E266B7|nr:response regulator [Flavipsychrobacter sp. JY13-12]